jgi:protein MpaA
VSQHLRVATVTTVLALVGGCATATPMAAPGRHLASAPRRTAPAPLVAPARARLTSPTAVRTVIGHSLQGRPLVSLTLGRATAPRRIVVVGCIHGDEIAGIPLAMTLLGRPVGRDVQLTVLPDINPDGHALHRRQNARGVDLNRNFPRAWRPLGKRGDQQYSGTGPLSEPESQAVAALLRRLRPTTTVWFHQPVGIVDESGGSLAVERRFSVLSGLPLRRIVRYPGSATGWENAGWPGTTAFVVELPHLVSAGLRAHVMRALGDLTG